MSPPSLRALIVEYEMTGSEDALAGIIKEYLDAEPSEDAIDSLEKQIDESHDADQIYFAINQAYILGYETGLEEGG